MNITDIVIVAVVVAIFAVCVRSFIRSNANGECADCALDGNCSVHDSGHCEISEDIVAKAAQAADAYTRAHPEVK